MLQPIPVILASYNPEWPRIAAMHAQHLRALGSNLVAVHHIGSTSVPGLIAKPIVDLMPVVTSLTNLDEQRQYVEALGYGWHGELGILGRRYCTLANELGVRVVQLHFFKTDSPHVERHIAFRDYLCAIPKRPMHMRSKSAVRKVCIPQTRMSMPTRRANGFKPWKPRR
jgi:GrpB-like predicted nucleotidyltransferase (UPF0157 family)